MPDWYFHFLSPCIFPVCSIFMPKDQSPHFRTALHLHSAQSVCSSCPLTPEISHVASGVWLIPLQPPPAEMVLDRPRPSCPHAGSPNLADVPPALAFLSWTWHGVMLLSASSTLSKVLIFAREIIFLHNKNTPSYIPKYEVRASHPPNTTSALTVI